MLVVGAELRKANSFAEALLESISGTRNFAGETMAHEGQETQAVPCQHSQPNASANFHLEDKNGDARSKFRNFFKLGAPGNSCNSFIEICETSRRELPDGPNSQPGGRCIFELNWYVQPASEFRQLTLWKNGAAEYGGSRNRDC